MIPVTLTLTNQALVIAKRRIALRYWLQGKGFHRALRAMDFAEPLHNGLRKDGVTPEFDHQISIAHHVRTLPDLSHQEETLATIFLHDVPEDIGVKIREIIDLFGDLVGEATELMTKYDEFGRPKDPQSMLAAMARNPIASIGKPADRSHNFQSMIGVFSPQKQLTYVVEGEQLIPMIREARRRFPQQERAYENLKNMLQCQATLIRASLANHPEYEQPGDPVTSLSPLEEE